MATIFDPWGQVSPYTIRAKVMFQNACLHGIGWDNEFTPEQPKQWKKFFLELPHLSNIQADKCFKGPTHDPDDASLSLHTSVDVSDFGVAVAWDVRAKYPDGHIKVMLAMSKAKPAPLHKQSIPMLELRAAALGT